MKRYDVECYIAYLASLNARKLLAVPQEVPGRRLGYRISAEIPSHTGELASLPEKFGLPGMSILPRDR